MLQETSASFDPELMCWGGPLPSAEDTVTLTVVAAVAAVAWRIVAVLLEAWRDRIPWKSLRCLWPLSWTSACLTALVWEIVTSRTASAGVLLEPPILIALGFVWTFAYGTARLTEWFVFRRREPLSLGLK